MIHRMECSVQTFTQYRPTAPTKVRRRCRPVPNLVRNVTDLTYLDQNSLIVTFNNRPPQLFRAPFNPKFLEEDVGAANAINTVATAEGDKILMTAKSGDLMAPTGGTV